MGLHALKRSPCCILFLTSFLWLRATRREKRRRWAAGAGNSGDGRLSFAVVLLPLIIRYSAQRHSDFAQ